VVFLNKVDEAKDPEMLELVELEMRELLNHFGYPGDETAFVAGSALSALEGKNPEIGEQKIYELLGELDKFVTPDRDVNTSVMFPAEHVYTIKGRGTVVTGKLERGTLKRGDKIKVIGYDREVPTQVTGVEMFHKTVEQAQPGDQLGVLLKGLGPKEVRRGVVIVPSDAKTTMTDKVKAQIYLLTPEEGGSKYPVANFFNEHVFSLTWDTIGSIRITGKDFIMPGENGEVEVWFHKQMFIEPQQRFTIRQGSTTVGTGVFTELLTPQTEAEKDKRNLKKMIKAEMERLGFNPYGEGMEKKCKPDFTNSPRDNPLASKFEGFDMIKLKQ